MSKKPKAARKPARKKNLTSRARSKSRRRRKVPPKSLPSEVEELLRRIGANAKQIREANGWTQSRSGYFGQGRSSYQAIEAGTRNLTLRTLLTVANALGTDVSGLIKPIGSGDDQSAAPAPASVKERPREEIGELLKHIGENIKRLRDGKKWTQGRMAYFDEESRNYRRIEAGQRNLTLRVLLRIARALEVDVSELTTRSGK